MEEGKFILTEEVKTQAVADDVNEYDYCDDSEFSPITFEELQNLVWEKGWE